MNGRNDRKAVVFALNWRPEYVAAIGSLLLSAIALIDDPVLNRDGMLYVSVARVALEQGVGAAMADFDWPFLSLLLAGVSRLTFLDPAWIAGAYSVLSILVLSVLVVRICRLVDQRMAWPAVLFVLGAPVFNWYRADLLRDTGGWALFFAALYLLLLWKHSPTPARALGFQVAALGAVAFRPEMAYLVPAVMLWLLLPGGKRLLSRESAWLLGPCLVVGVLGIAGMLLFHANTTERLVQAANMLNPSERLQVFTDATETMARRVLSEHSSEEAGQILVVGMVSVIFSKWIKLLGLFVIPAGYALYRPPRFADRTLFRVLLGSLFLVLVLFVTWSLYLASRHAALLALLSAPWVCAGMLALAERFPRALWHRVFGALVVIAALSGVISTGPGKDYLKDAGNWLARHPEFSGPSTWYADRQVEYYATDHYPAQEDESPSLEEMLAASEPRETLVVPVEREKTAQMLRDWLAGHPEYRLIRRFDNGHDDSVWVLSRRETQR